MQRTEAGEDLLAVTRQLHPHGARVVGVRGAFDEPLTPLPGVAHRVRLSVGVALSGRASTPESLLAAANEAMTQIRHERQGTGRHG